MLGLGDEPEGLMCSRAGCTNPAAWRVQWRNPRIHSEDRVKVWLACDDHQEYLREYLAARDFPVAVFPADAAQENPAQEDGDR